jgi:hypothetical protein
LISSVRNMYGRPPLGKGFLGAANASGAVMYTASDCGQ